MKILIVTQNAPVYIHLCLDKCLSLIKSTKHTVQGIVLLSPYAKKNAYLEFLNRFSLYGLLGFIGMSAYVVKEYFLSFLFTTLKLRDCHSIMNVIDKHRINCLEFDSVNSEEFITYTKKNRIDLLVSIAAPELFGKTLLESTRLGCINYHSALLPKYRGRQPLFWAMLNDDENVGVSIIEMDETLDGGPILAQIQVPVNGENTLHNLYLRTLEKGARLLVSTIENISAGKGDRIENSSKYATTYPFPKKEDGTRF